jgi:hypothetical protein
MMGPIGRQIVRNLLAEFGYDAAHLDRSIPAKPEPNDHAPVQRTDQLGVTAPPKAAGLFLS